MALLYNVIIAYSCESNSSACNTELRPLLSNWDAVRRQSLRTTTFIYSSAFRLGPQTLQWIDTWRYSIRLP